jgi:hypothetical protein
MPAIKIGTTRVETHEVSVSGTELLELLREHFKQVIPQHARVCVQVPRGGDYSGIELEIDQYCPITVTWSQTTKDD